jgi:hypothetical protein
VPGEGHFASSERKTAFIAFYIKKAAQYRLPAQTNNENSIKLVPIDPTKTGWLADKWRADAPPTAPSAPIDKYTGDKTQAFWYFDEETVRKVEEYGALYRGLQPQLVGIVQEGKLVPQKNTHLQIDLQFLPLEDGISFKLEGKFYDTVPAGSPRLPAWTGLNVGSPIGHAKQGGPVIIDRVAGPFKKINANTFAMQLEKGLEANPKNYVFTFVARHPGDNTFKPAVQQAQMIIAAVLTEGSQQQINFPAIENTKGKKSIQLKAFTDSGLPVYYYILEGPATISGNKLSFKKIPPKAKFPLKVTVVAWQYGSKARKIQTATPVERSFYIRK